jgi:hypothetical protein
VPLVAIVNFLRRDSRFKKQSLILGTFIGLVAGIYLASTNLASDNIVLAKQAMQQLLHGASLAFITSIFGLSSSIVFSWRENIGFIASMNAWAVGSRNSKIACNGSRPRDLLAIVSLQDAVIAPVGNGFEIQIEFAILFFVLKYAAQPLRTPPMPDPYRCEVLWDRAFSP